MARFQNVPWVDGTAGLAAGAHTTWAALCGVAAVALVGTAPAFGVAHVMAEGPFVGGLAALEWQHRRALRTAA